MIKKVDFRERLCGIDLLRLILMYMVVLIHILGHGGILEAVENSDDNLKYSVYYLIKVIVTCSVDCYALISGFVSSNRETQNYSKIINRWLQVVFYSLGLSLILAALGFVEIKSFKTVIRLLIPVTGGEYWYFTCFFALFFMQPYINKMLNSLHAENQKKMFWILMVLFSFQGVLTDPYHMNAGFSAAWITVLYILGNLMRRIDLFGKIRCKYLGIIFLMTVLVSWIPIVFLRKTIFTSCLSPTMVLQSMMLIEIFSKLKSAPDFLIKISSLSFGVYLFHENNYVRELIIKSKFVFVKDLNLIQGGFVLFGTALLIFIIGLIVDEIRTLLFELINIERISEDFFKLIRERRKNNT